MQPPVVKVKAKPKGVAILEMDGDPAFSEVLIIPEFAAQLWYLSRSEDGTWGNTLLIRSGIPKENG